MGRFDENHDGNTFYHKDLDGVPENGEEHEVDISNHPMMIMVDERKLELLQHSLCLSIIQRKWNLNGRRSYYFQLAYYLLFLTAITSYVLTSPSKPSPSKPGLIQLHRLLP